MYLDSENKVEDFTIAAQEYVLELIAVSKTVGDDASVLVDDAAFSAADVNTYFSQLEFFPNIDLSNQTIEERENVRFEFHVAATNDISLTERDSTSQVDRCEAEDYYVLDALFYYNLTLTYDEVYVDSGSSQEVCGDVSGLLDLVDIPTTVLFHGPTKSVTANPVASFLLIAKEPRGLIYNMNFNFRSDEGQSNVYTLRFHVVGIYAHAGALSLPLPRQDALYILRDPPGDSSFSEFSEGNTIEVSFFSSSGSGTHYSTERTDSLGVEAELDFSTDVGGCFGAEVTAGVELGKVEGHAIVAVGMEGFDSKTTTNEDSVTKSITASQSFTTTTDERNPGRLSDMYLIPSFNIEIGISTNYSYVAECTITDDEINSWTIPEEVKETNMFAWISEYHIESVEIPLVERQLADFDEIFCFCSHLDYEEDDCQKKCELERALKSWQRNLQLNADLTSEELQPLFPQSSNRINEDNFDRRAFGDINKLYKYQLNGDEVEEANMLFLTGGGATQSYSYESSNSVSLSYIVTIETDESISGNTDIGANVLGVVRDITLDYTKGESSEDTTQRDVTQTHTTTTSFTLQDDDWGDDFSVSVYEDKNGWLVFKTVSGRSSCPYEHGTIDRVDWDFANDLALGNPREVSGVFSDESVSWVLTLLNNVPDYRDVILTNIVPLTFFPIRNGDAISLKFNGAPFVYDLDVYPEPKKEMHFDLVASRPFGDVYDFDFTVCVYLSCEPERTKDLDFTLHFIQHCPKAEFDFSDIQLITAESITKDIPSDPDVWSIQANNPNYRTDTPWPDTDDLKIRLQFRRVSLFGVSRWTAVDNTFDFSKNLTNGFTTYDWDLISMSDGDYDLRYISICKDFNTRYGDTGALSDILPIIIDFDPPRIVKFPEPQDALYSLGDEVSFQFNEPISCVYIAKLFLYGEEDYPLLSSEDGSLKTVCVNKGMDGKILFDLNDYIAREFRVGDVYVTKILAVSDIHGNFMEAQEFQTWQFVVTQERTDISMFIDEYVANSAFCDVIVSVVTPSTDDPTTNVTGTYVFSANYCNNKPTYYNEAIGLYLYYWYTSDWGWVIHDELCELDYSGPGSLILGGLILKTSDSAEFLADPWMIYDGNGTGIEGYSVETLGFKCFDSEASLLLSMNDDSTFSTSWTEQMSHLLGVSKDRLTIQEIQEHNLHTESRKKTSLLEDSESPDTLSGGLITFSVNEKWLSHHYENGESSHEKIGGTLEGILHYDENIAQEYPSLYLNAENTKKTIKAKVVRSHKPDCDDDIFEPFLQTSKSFFDEMDTLTLQLSTSIYLRDLDISFEGRVNPVANFVFSSTTVPSKSHYWSFDVPATDRCSRMFVFKMNWLEFFEDVIGSEIYNGSFKGAIILSTTLQSYRLPFAIIHPETDRNNINTPTIDGSEEYYVQKLQILGEACGRVSTVVNGGDMVHCENVLSGEDCSVVCAPKFIPREPSIQCIDGQWTVGHCDEKMYTVPPGKMSDIWKSCGENGGHLVSIHNISENNAVRDLCRDTVRHLPPSDSEPSNECYIGLLRRGRNRGERARDGSVTSEREDDVSFSWVDSSKLDFEFWDLREPSNFIIPKEKFVVINAETGRWSDLGQGELIRPGICSAGECIPSIIHESFEDIEIDICEQIPSVSPSLRMSDGCSTWSVEGYKEIPFPESNTIFRVWSNPTNQFGSFYTQTIKQIDSYPKLLNVPEESYIFIECETNLPQLEEITASDICDGHLHVMFEEIVSNSNDSCERVITRKWSATDSSGQTSVFEQNIFVVEHLNESNDG